MPKDFTRNSRVFLFEKHNSICYNKNVMIDRKIKNELLEKIKEKEDKIRISSILDKAIKFERENTVFVTNFLNLKEYQLAEKILNHFSIKYTVLSINEMVEKKNIAFIPEYLEKEKVFLEHVSCIKIKAKGKSQLLHKDYMGAIYSLGVKREMIGDIILKENSGYFFCMKSVEEYFFMNLNSVGKNEVKLEGLDLFSDEVKNLSASYIEREYIVPSFRIDAILSAIYHLSRSETKEKIVKGDLFINDRNIYYSNTIVYEGDVVSFRKCGKLKVGKEIRKTRSNNIVVQIFKYN